MAEQRRAARAAWKGSGDKASDELWFDLVEEKGGTEFVGYTSEQGEGEIIAIVRDGARVDRAGVGDTVDIVTNQTPFYGESGGQVGDAGIFSNDDGLRSEEHTSELQSLMRISYAVFCLKKKKKKQHINNN